MLANVLSWLDAFWRLIFAHAFPITMAILLGLAACIIAVLVWIEAGWADE